MKEIKAKYKGNSVINKKIGLVIPALLLAGGTIMINQNTVKADTAPQVTAASTENADDIATSAEYGKIGGDTGSDWNIDSNGVLHIQSGTWDDSSVESFWNNAMSSDGKTLNSQEKITSAIFEGDVTTGSSLKGLFEQATNLKSVSVASGAKFDTSNTTNFSSMFDQDTSLKNIDTNLFNWENVENSSNMFSNTGLESVTMNNINAPKLSNATQMFSNCKTLKNANFDGINFADSGVTLDQFLNNCSELSNISLKNAFTGKITSAGYMFNNDNKIKDLDVSSMDLSDPSSSIYSNMFYVDSDISLRKSITLPANANVRAMAIDNYDNTMYKGWTNGSSDDVVRSLSEYYANNANIGKTTWTLVDKDKANYKVNYKDQDGNLIETKSENGVIGNPITITQILGYSDPANSESNPATMLVGDNNDQEFTVVLKKLAPYKVNVNVTYGDGHPGESFSVDIPYGLTNFSEQVDQSNLDKFTGNVDLEQSKMNMLEQPEMTLAYLQSGLGLELNDLSLKSVFNEIMDALIKQLDLNHNEDISGMMINTFDMYFDKYEQPTNNNGGGSTVNSEVTNIDQKSATFGDKVTSLYDKNGNLISDIKLAKNSDWKNDQKMILDGITYYRVSTNAWVKASDVYVYTDLDSKVRVHADKRSRIAKPTGILTDRALEKSTEWKTDRYATINGEKYYRVSTEGFVKANEVSEYK